MAGGYIQAPQFPITGGRFVAPTKVQQPISPYYAGFGLRQTLSTLKTAADLGTSIMGILSALDEQQKKEEEAKVEDIIKRGRTIDWNNAEEVTAFKNYVNERYGADDALAQQTYALASHLPMLPEERGLRELDKARQEMESAQQNNPGFVGYNQQPQQQTQQQQQGSIGQILQKPEPKEGSKEAALTGAVSSVDNVYRYLGIPTTVNPQNNIVPIVSQPSQPQQQQQPQQPQQQQQTGETDKKALEQHKKDVEKRLNPTINTPKGRAEKESGLKFVDAVEPNHPLAEGLGLNGTIGAVYGYNPKVPPSRAHRVMRERELERNTPVEAYYNASKNPIYYGHLLRAFQHSIMAAMYFKQFSVATDEKAVRLYMASGSEFMNMLKGLRDEGLGVSDEMLLDTSGDAPLTVYAYLRAAVDPDFAKQLAQSKGQLKGETALDSVRRQYNNMNPRLRALLLGGSTFMSTLKWTGEETGKYLNNLWRLQRDPRTGKVIAQDAGMSPKDAANVGINVAKTRIQQEQHGLKQLDVWHNAINEYMKTYNNAKKNQSLFYDRLQQEIKNPLDKRTGALLKFIDSALNIAKATTADYTHMSPIDVMFPQTGKAGGKAPLPASGQGPSVWQRDAYAIALRKQLFGQMMSALKVALLGDSRYRFVEVPNPQNPDQPIYKLQMLGPDGKTYVDAMAPNKDGVYELLAPIKVNITLRNYKSDGSINNDDPYKKVTITIKDVSDIPDIMRQLAKAYNFDAAYINNDPDLQKEFSEGRIIANNLKRQGFPIEDVPPNNKVMDYISYVTNPESKFMKRRLDNVGRPKLTFEEFSTMLYNLYPEVPSEYHYGYYTQYYSPLIDSYIEEGKYNKKSSSKKGKSK